MLELQTYSVMTNQCTAGDKGFIYAGQVLYQQSLIPKSQKSTFEKWKYQELERQLPQHPQVTQMSPTSVLEDPVFPSCLHALHTCGAYT